jgi:phospholipase/carboxylesterase
MRFFPLFSLLMMISCGYSSLTKAQSCEPLTKGNHYQKNGTLEYIERTPSPNHSESPIVIALHGLGHHKEGFSGLASKLPKHWRIFFIDAPLTYHRGHAWYRFRCPEAELDLQQSVEAVFKTLHTLTLKYPTAPKPAIFGFSQGGVMTMELINQAPLLWSAAANFSGYWLSKTPPQKRQDSEVLHLLLVHGERDRIVPIKRGLEAAKLMGDANFLISWLPFDGGHHVPRIGLEQLAQHFESAWMSTKK